MSLKARTRGQGMDTVANCPGRCTFRLVHGVEWKLGSRRNPQWRADQ